MDTVRVIKMVEEVEVLDMIMMMMNCTVIMTITKKNTKKDMKKDI